MRAPALPARGGAGLKPWHVAELLREPAALGFVEVHAENYMVAGGALHRQLEQVRACLPVSLHGVGLAIGGASPPDREHLQRLAALVRRYEPDAFSEHLAWSGHGGVFFNDLLPLPYDRAMLERVCANVQQVQETLGLRMLLENPSTYVVLAGSEMGEAAFLSEVVRRTGCGLLLDLTNAWVSCTNRREDVRAYLAALPLHAVGEIHLAGVAREEDADGTPLLIDTHGSAIDSAVWTLYEEMLERLGPVPTLIEWDNDVPAFDRLLAETRLAQHALERAEALA